MTIAGLLVVGLGLGFDSLRVAAVLALNSSLTHRMRVAVSFGVWDGLASLAGLCLGHELVLATAPESRSLAVAALGLSGLWLLRESDADDGDVNRLSVWVPAVLSLDNLAAGLALGAAGTPVLGAVVLGAASAGMALVGLGIGRRARDRLPRHAERTGAVLLLVLAATKAVGLT